MVHTNKSLFTFNLKVWRLWPQILMVFLCNISIISYGFQTAWITSLQPDFQSNHSSLGLPAMTDGQISWIGSLPSITSAIGTPFFGWTMDRFGRRPALFLATLPNLLTYLLLFIATDIRMVYASRLVGGFCAGGAFIVSFTFIAECSEPFLRETVTSLSGFFMKTSMIISIVLGSYTSLVTLHSVSCAFTVLFVILMFWIPESPSYLLIRGQRSKARETLTKLWGDDKQDLIDLEISIIEKTLSRSRVNQWTQLKRFITKRPLRKALIISLLVYAFPLLAGFPVIIRYSVDILSDAGLEFSPFISAIFIVIAPLISSFFGAMFIKKIGAKSLVVWSLLGMATSMTIFAVYLFLLTSFPDSYILHEINIISFVSLLLFITFDGAGFATVTYSIIPILFSSEARATAAMLLNIWFACFEFLGAETYFSIRNAVGLSGVMALYAGIGFIGVIVLKLIMFEVKNLDFDQVQSKLSGKKT